MSTPLVVQKIKWVIFDFGWPHSFMALVAASFPSLGTSTTTMSCLASKEVIIRIGALINTVRWSSSANGKNGSRTFCPLSLADLSNTHHLSYSLLKKN
ncbi:hypothetical protein Lal_00027436 [Lupinus albus]|nr:hypothetical protein Lal_00027436 [Lupinus albus]